MTSPRHQQILDVAARMISERGYRDTSMRDISDEIGLKAGSLYSHIRSKEEVLFFIMNDLADRLCVAARAAADGDGTPPERLRDFVRRTLGVVEDAGDNMLILLFEWRYLDPPRRAQIKQKRDEGEMQLTRILDDGARTGDFVGDSRKWARLTILSVTNWSTQWLRADGQLTAEQVADEFVDLFLDGLVPRT